jgi:hypothetical protein
MPRYAHLAWAVLLSACVDLTRPLELRPRDTTNIGTEGDAGDDGPAGPDLDPGQSPDAAEPVMADAAAPALEPDAATTEPAADAATPVVPDAPVVDLRPPLSPPDAPLRGNGSACTTGGQCQSGQCIDSFCCNLPCNGRCQACDVAGAEGRCTPIKAGDDPDNECAIEAVSTCGRDGSCDGQGNCRKYPVGLQCMPGSCTGSMETGASTCTAAGTCQAGATKMCMGGHMCTAGSCASMCNADGECQNGFFCDNKACQVKRPAGASCTAANQCAGGFCVDGVCCNIACDQTCYACDLPGSVGTCNAIPDGQERGATPECPAQEMATCGRVGGCNGRGACRLFTTDAVCGAQSCSGSVQTDARTCNGVGACAPVVTRDCGAYVCAGNACANNCTSAAQCKPGNSCVGNACRPIKITSLVVHDTVAANKALWSIQNNFQIGVAGAHPWGDPLWVDTYIKSMDAGASLLLTKEWIHVSAESKKYNDGPQATLTLSAAADVYIVVDDRWPLVGGTLPWTTGWTKMAVKVVVYESTTRPSLPFTLYKKSAASGSFDLPKIGAYLSPPSYPAYNYFVVVD